MEVPGIVQLQVVVFLLAVLSGARAVVEKHFVEGGNMVLEPKVAVTITNILWKHNGDLLAEWVKDAVNLTYYDTFEGRTTLDVTTGRLEIKSMTKADVGSYTLEINNMVHRESYTAKAIKKVPKPSVWIQPVACTRESLSCKLLCEGRTPGGTPEDTREAEPITYSWRRDEDMWMVLEKELKIDKETAAGTKKFSCRMENPFSMKESEPKDNPLYEEPSSHVGGIVGGIFGLAAIVLAGIGVYKKDVIKAWFKQNGANTNTNDVNGSREANDYKLVGQKTEDGSCEANDGCTSENKLVGLKTEDGGGGKDDPATGV